MIESYKDNKSKSDCYRCIFLGFIGSFIIVGGLHILASNLKTQPKSLEHNKKIVLLQGY